MLYFFGFAVLLALITGVSLGASITRYHLMKKHERATQELRDYFGDMLRESFGYWPIDPNVPIIRDLHPNK